MEESFFFLAGLVLEPHPKVLTSMGRKKRLSLSNELWRRKIKEEGGEGYEEGEKEEKGEVMLHLQKERGENGGGTKSKEERVRELERRKTVGEEGVAGKRRKRSKG